jgi:predicted DNA repair protein MutK
VAQTLLPVLANGLIGIAAGAVVLAVVTAVKKFLPSPKPPSQPA